MVARTIFSWGLTVAATEALLSEETVGPVSVIGPVTLPPYLSVFALEFA